MNKPVAWIEPDVIPLTHIIKAVVRREQDEQYTIPLYTHPVKEQVIQECIDAIDDGDGAMSSMAEHNWRQVCVNELKAILRKAQEK